MEVITGFVLTVTLIAIYFAPTIVAMVRKHPQTTPIVLINLFAGWTLIGWVGALVWAAINFQTKEVRT